MLQGENVALREWREADLETLARLRNDVELQTLLMARARPNSIDRIRTWLTARASREDTVFFVIAVADSAIGYLQVADIDLFHGHGKVGICLAPEAHGRDLAREACALLDAYLIGTLGLRKLTLEVLAENTRAIGFYRKIGYRDVGVLQRHFRDGTGFHDVLVMERLLGP